MVSLQGQRNCGTVGFIKFLLSCFEGKHVLNISKFKEDWKKRIWLNGIVSSAAAARGRMLGVSSEVQEMRPRRKEFLSSPMGMCCNSGAVLGS